MPPSKKRKNYKTLDPSLLKKAKKSPFPASLEPMLSTLFSEPFTDPDWLYEVKWDGYRIIGHVNDGKVKLHSRSLLNYTKLYPPVARELEKLGYDAVLDGEVVVFNNKGRPSFDDLQQYKGNEPIIYYLFDLLWIDGYSLLDMELIERKRLLQKIIPDSHIIKFSDHFDDGVELFENMKEHGLEGIVAKRKVSLYMPGKRSRDWRKIPTAIRQEFVIGGWTESDRARSFRSLLFGYYQDGKLVFVGHAGGGFKENEMPAILAELKKIETKKKPFVNEVEIERVTHWVKPKLVAEIRYATWTRAGKIRKPAIFLGFRKDKKPTEVIPEKPIVEQTTIPGEQKTQTVKRKLPTSVESHWPEIENQRITSRELFSIDGHDLELVNVEKELWRGVTKADLIQYYHAIAEYMLPHLKDRPQSLHIKHAGVMRPGMYIKDMEGRQPEWAEVFSVKRKHKKEGKRDVINYLVCQNEATLLYMINLGCIDINPWTSHTTSAMYSDYIVIDVDPTDGDFSKVIETAKAAKGFFDEKKLIVFPKTSGKSGFHFLIPCAGFTFEQARMIAEDICTQIHELVPGITTTEVSIAHRGNKVYLDPNQNDEADTVAAAYSVRPWHVPDVSTPLEWKEINNDLHPHQFNIHTIPDRIKKKGELFQDLLKKKIAVSNSKRLSY